MPWLAGPRDRTARICAVLGLYALAGGVVTLLGWAFDLPRLTDWGADGISQMPNNALAVAVAGLAMLLHASGRAGPGVALGAVTGAIGAATLYQHATGIDLGIDRVLVYREWGQRGTVAPGRMGPPGATSLLVIGASIVLIGSARTRRFGVMGGLLAMAIAMLSLVGYAYGADLLFTLPRLTAIALQTSTMLFALGAAIVVAVPEALPMRLLLGDAAAARLFRRALPIIVVLPILLGWLRLLAGEAGLVDLPFGIAMLVISLIALLTALLWWSISLLHDHEAAERRVREQLREADRRKDRFLATLAHELRNPLAALHNALELERRSAGSLRQEERSLMERQVAHLTRLVDDLLELSRAGQNRMYLRKQPVELSDVIREAVALCQPLVEKFRHELTVSSGSARLEGDPVRLAQVIANLLINACKYTDPGGKLDLSVAARDGEVEITVRDNGIGIPAGMLDAIFEMFTQVEGGSRRVDGGLGIGLTVVQRVVELHGGSVTAASAGPGLGSAFTVRLPTGDAASPPIPPNRVS